MTNTTDAESKSRTKSTTGLTHDQICDIFKSGNPTDEEIRIVQLVEAYRGIVPIAQPAQPSEQGDAKDALRYRWLRDVLQSAKGGASLDVNAELAYYEQPELGKEVALQWYPDTPIGFYKVEGATLDVVIDAAILASKPAGGTET